jgi:signal transduction histidine kinase
MTTLPLFPVWLIDALGSALVIILGWAAFRLARRSLRQAPDNALWLFLYWLTLALLVFSLSRGVGHILGHLLVFTGYEAVWHRLRPYTGGLNSIMSIVVASVTLFFHAVQRLYRRMEADHHRLEETSKEILTLNREMEALVMERTMSEMALGIADGIRNPLHIIGGFSHRLLKKTAADDPARNWAAAIAQEARNLEEMVGRFESLAERKEAFFSQENLNTLVRDILEILHPELERKDLRLVRSFHPHPIMGRLNRHLLKVALAHLLRNSIEATPRGGEIQVSTSAEPNRAAVVIADNGRGMAPEVAAQVFEPFYTTKVGGTGLGMVFVRQIVDEHRGEINLESQLGKGTKVVIHLPLRFAEAQMKEGKAGST